MKLAVLSGKGGAGKTLVSVNLACAAGKAVYVDCDVEEPNGRLFLKPTDLVCEDVYTMLPSFNEDSCIGCRRCVDFCRFNALALVRRKHRLFEEVCHSCGGCSLVCPMDAVSEVKKKVGQVEYGWHGRVRAVTGILRLGEASAMPVVNAALAHLAEAELSIIDCPPGSGCAVMGCVASADMCLLIAEPTAFGLHNLKMVYELAALLKKPIGIVINRELSPYPPLDEFCAENSLPVLGRIPYSEKYARMSAAGEILTESDAEASGIFHALLSRIGGELQ